jgi:hypothetical protein
VTHHALANSGSQHKQSCRWLSEGYQRNANAMSRDIGKGLETEFFRYLTKPIKINACIKALDETLKIVESNHDHANGTEKNP